MSTFGGNSVLQGRTDVGTSELTPSELDCSTLTINNESGLFCATALHRHSIHSKMQHGWCQLSVARWMNRTLFLLLRFPNGVQIHRDRNNPENWFKSLLCYDVPRGSDQETLLNISQQFSTYVDPRKNARDRWKLNKKTDTIAVRSIATEVEYTCEYANGDFINRDFYKIRGNTFCEFWRCPYIAKSEV